MSKEFTKNSTNQISLKSDRKDDFKIIVVKQKKFEDIKNISNENKENKILNQNYQSKNFSNEKKENNKIIQSRNININKKNNLILTSSIDNNNNSFSKEIKKIINNKI